MTNNKSKIIADYEFWVKFEDWDIEQMTALLLGYNPMYIDRKYIDQLSFGEVETSMSQQEINMLVFEYDKTFAIVMNAIETGKLKFRVTPNKFYNWAMSKGLPIFDQFHEVIKNKKPCGVDCEINPKRIKQLYKIILSLAIKYKYNPENLKNPSTTKFRNAIERAGFTIDDNTIRDVVLKSYEQYKDRLDHSVFEN